MQTITGTSPAINITRALSRLKSVFVTFDQIAVSPTTGKPVAHGVGASSCHLELWKRSWNDFYHPVTNSNKAAYDQNYEIEYQLQVGSKLLPDFPMRSLQEQSYQLRHCMGTE